MLAQLEHVSIPLEVFVRLKTVIGRLKSKRYFKCVTLVLLFIIYLSVGKSEQEPLVVIVDCRVRSRLKYLFLIGCAQMPRSKFENIFKRKFTFEDILKERKSTRWAKGGPCYR